MLYVEHDDHEIDDEQIDPKINRDETPEYRVNVRVQNIQRDRDFGMSL